MLRRRPSNFEPRLTAFVAILGLLWLPVVRADVLSAGRAGFVVQSKTVIEAPRGRVWQAAIDEVSSWWNDDLTVSGDASRLNIDARPLGCFCEMLGGDDGVTHLVVTTASTHVMLRMTGGLGPLGLMGVNGNMTWEFFDAAENDATEVRFTYAVGGYSPEGLDALAEPVDRVVSEALELLKSHVEIGADDRDAD